MEVSGCFQSPHSLGKALKLAERQHSVSGRHKTIALPITQGIGTWHSVHNTGGVTLTRLPGVVAEEEKPVKEN
eukprot:8504346-Ditylum_brightwellii.AAC.1